MSKLYSLIEESVRTSLRPESVLGLEPERALGRIASEDPESACKAHYLAAKCRFPQMLDLYLTLNRSEGKNLTRRLCLDIVRNDDRQVPFTRVVMKEFIELYNAGISLSWWLFGKGRHVHVEPEFEPCSLSMPLRNAIRMMCYKQGWTELDGQWLVTQTQPTGGDSVNKVLARVMSALPQMNLLPVMPSVIEVYERLVRAVETCPLSASCEKWVTTAITWLRKNKKDISLLMLVSYVTIRNWKLGRIQPRRKTQRLAYMISMLLDLYGEHDGFIFYLKILNEEAKSQGYRTLNEILSGHEWRLSRMVRLRDRVRFS